MSHVSILGCGWLGLPLAKTFIEKGFQVNGSTTSENKITVLKVSGIEPFLISLSENGLLGNIEGFLQNASILIIDIPPKRNEGGNFSDKIWNLIPLIENSGIEKVLFISSTSVYADDNTVISENTIPKPYTESGKELLKSENLLQNQSGFQTTILRFGGLIGNDRHPVKFLAGRQNLENPDAPINLIHQKDCIGIILKIIEAERWNEIFNAAAPFHPSRKEYYSQKAMENGLPPPEFNNMESIGKIIDSKKITEDLGYQFLITDL